MQKLFKDDSFTLHTDLYQINMMQTYWELGRADLNGSLRVLLSVTCPLRMAMLSFAGLERLVDYLNNLIQTYWETFFRFRYRLFKINRRISGGFLGLSERIQICLHGSFSFRR